MCCYKELKRLYGLQRGELEKDDFGQYRKISETNGSIERYGNKLSQDDIAQEVGFSFNLFTSLLLILC